VARSAIDQLDKVECRSNKEGKQMRKLMLGIAAAATLLCAGLLPSTRAEAMPIGAASSVQVAVQDLTALEHVWCGGGCGYGAGYGWGGCGYAVGCGYGAGYGWGYGAGYGWGGCGYGAGYGWGGCGYGAGYGWGGCGYTGGCGCGVSRCYRVRRRCCY
jgi:hypothetical protein